MSFPSMSRLDPHGFAATRRHQLDGPFRALLNTIQLAERPFKLREKHSLTGGTEARGAEGKGLWNFNVGSSLRRVYAR
jgi:hypothetical protein